MSRSNSEPIDAAGGRYQCGRATINNSVEAESSNENVVGGVYAGVTAV